MAPLRTIIVVGTSLAGFRGIEALRRDGYEGRIIAVGEEPHAPYDRPPLSKQFLKGQWEADKFALRGLGPEPLEVDWRHGERAMALDPSARRLTLEGGEELHYDGLLIATGAAARPLPPRLHAGQDPPSGVHLLRSLDDALALRAELAAAPRVVVIGAGFIGMEVAASCRERGLEVTVVEALETPLVRGLGPQLGDYVSAVYRDEGVALRCGVAVERIEGVERVECVVLADGTRIPADIVVAGVGATPAVEWLAGSGLDVEDGVVCDASCATTAPGVVAAGDVARWLDHRSGRRVRAEHWTNAVEQGGHAARRLLRGPEVGAYDAVPYVWTDLFHLRIQIAGEVRPGDAMRVRHGSFEEGRFVALFGRDGRLTGAVGFRRPRQLQEARDRIGSDWDSAQAAIAGD